MKKDLSNLRLEISKYFLDFRSYLNERRKIIAQIKAFKNENKQDAFDALREYQLFSSRPDWAQDISLQEVLAYSLIMEGQQEGTNYPAFSKRVHLSQSNGEIYEMINPIMLKIWYPEYFNGLKFTERFDFIRNI